MAQITFTTARIWLHLPTHTSKEKSRHTKFANLNSSKDYLDYTIEFKLSINDSTEMWKYLYHLDLPRQLPCFALYNAIHAT